MAPRGRQSVSRKASAASFHSDKVTKSLPSRPNRCTSTRASSSGIESPSRGETETPLRQSSARRLLKEVAIHTMNPPSKSKGSNGSLTNGSSNGSKDSSRDASADYETTGTSISVTPATLSSKSKLPLNLSSGKRSRMTSFIHDSEEDEEMDTDTELAWKLQQEEYGNEVSTGKARVVPSRRVEFKDDTDSDDDLSDALSMDSFLQEPPQKKQMVRQGGRGKPIRQASNKARQSFANIEPSDDDLAPFPIASDSEDFVLQSSAQESEVVESETDMDTAAPVAGPSTNAKKRKPTPKPLSAADKRLKKHLARQRLNKYRHIGDRWERKRAMNRDRLEESHPQLTTMWKTLQFSPIIIPEQATQPQSISRKLKSFQLEGLNWMVKQEKTHYRGGLLGDEMGMGKTIQAVSLIMSDYPAKSPSLVVVPPVALMQWSNEIREYTDGTLKVLVYHGTNTKTKNMSIKELKKFDVILVSYNSLESLYRKETKGWSRGENIIKEASPIHAIKFHRLILDEAHSIKSRTTGVAKACFALKGDYKWCLSGTPVQNRIGEFFSLLRFLEVRPFADYFCRSCDCEQLHWSLNDDHMCPRCMHSGAEHVSVFNQELLNPITGDDPELREEALEKLHTITARMMLRRMKRDHTSSMELPPKEVIVHNEFFGEIERDFSSSIMSNTSRKFDTYVAQRVVLNNYANIFGLIMQMRQVANHPDLLLKKHAEGGQNVLVCNICDEPAEEAVRSRCRHEFCRSCIKSYIQSYEKDDSPDCPRCHIALAIDLEQPDIEQDEDLVKKSSIINRIKMENWTSSSKIEMLVYDLYKLRSKKQTLKSIVFSQFTSMLQLIEWRLRRAGFNTVMLDGSMTPAQRQKSIEYFMTNTDVEVFLVSLKAGGVALNLTEASRVFIVDPWWNPAAEWQSADRCHRIGQKRPCVITRLVIEDSVESRMVLLQEKKAAMISGTINNDKVAMDKLTPEDLQFLFRGT